MLSFLNSKKGMTLVEVMAAVLILGIVVVPLASFFLFSMQRARYTQEQRRALSIGEAHMEWLRQERFVPAFTSEEEIVEPISFDDGKYTVYTELEAVTVPGGSGGEMTMYKVIVRVVWRDREVKLSTLSSINR